MAWLKAAASFREPSPLPHIFLTQWSQGELFQHKSFLHIVNFSFFCPGSRYNPNKANIKNSLAAKAARFTVKWEHISLSIASLWCQPSRVLTQIYALFRLVDYRIATYLGARWQTPTFILFCVCLVHIWTGNTRIQLNVETSSTWGGRQSWTFIVMSMQRGFYLSICTQVDPVKQGLQKKPGERGMGGLLPYFHVLLTPTPHPHPHLLSHNTCWHSLL